MTILPITKCYTVVNEKKWLVGSVLRGIDCIYMDYFVQGAAFKTSEMLHHRGASLSKQHIVLIYVMAHKP